MAFAFITSCVIPDDQDYCHCVNERVSKLGLWRQVVVSGPVRTLFIQFPHTVPCFRGPFSRRRLPKLISLLRFPATLPPSLGTTKPEPIT